MTPRYPPATWAREAERSQERSDDRRAQGRRYRRRVWLEWFVIVATVTLIVLALVLGVRL